MRNLQSWRPLFRAQRAIWRTPCGSRARLVFACFFALAAGLTTPGEAAEVAQEEASSSPAAEQQGGAVPVVTAATPTYLERITVAATRSERALKDAPGQVDVIMGAEVAELGLTSVADLVRMLPGIYVEGDLTRLGTSGLNIRGIGGNRVLTQIDGIPTAEQFDFGPLSITQFALDPEALASVEIVRSAGSALYGSDALGGVVSLVTRSPQSYLGDRPHDLSLRVGYDSRAEEASATATAALGNNRWRGSLLIGHRDGASWDNQGELASRDFTRTLPNPSARRQDNVLFKLGHDLRESAQLETAIEWFDGRATTEVLSSRTPASPFSAAVLDFDAVDRQERRRLSVESSHARPTRWFDTVLWRAYGQDAETAQVTREMRQGAGGPSVRDGLLTFEQQTLGSEVTARKALDAQARQMLTYGLSVRQDRFDQLRDRSEFFLGSGQPVPTPLIFPTKYFPQSEVVELGLFVQGEHQLGNRLRLVPGLRFDRYRLAADSHDAVYLQGNPGTLAPVDLTDAALSPKLGLVFSLSPEVSLFAQAARGFRAPPMSAVNNGFTNQTAGYRTLPNPDLRPETSDNLELGLRGVFSRGSFSVVAFDNRYRDFIDTLTLGFNPQVGLVDFQPQNIARVRITGLELGGEAQLGRAFRVRGAYSWTTGDDQVSKQPLLSIAPPMLVLALRCQPAGARWGLQATGTAVAAKDQDDLPTGSTQFRTPAYEVFDLAAWFELNRHFSLQASVWNLGDATYWQWSYVRGQTADASTLDRYTSPGRNVGLGLRTHF